MLKLQSNPTIALPTEILIEITKYLAKPDAAMLTRVSRFFNSFSTPVLYQNVRLTFDDTTVQCCKALIRNNLASQSVKTLGVRWYVPSEILEIMSNSTSVRPASPEFWLSSFLHLIRSVLLKLPALTSLYLPMFYAGQILRGHLVS